uniref:Uncharacterized protein n=1 Tax=Lepeophtheirus salmonis TaxID=72036 RepID=A0A0K2TXM7_LEPSM
MQLQELLCLTFFPSLTELDNIDSREE